MKPFPLLLAFGCALSLLARGADYDQAVDNLIPQLAAADVASRYAAQMALQDLASQASRPEREGDRKALSRTLSERVPRTAIPQPARVWMIRQLEYMGGTEAVEALDQLLDDSDAELRECARRALEKNPAPAASASLRQALRKGGDTRWRIGLMHALGERGDGDAVTFIRQGLAEASTFNAAVIALGQIATPEAIEALKPRMNESATAAEALVTAANSLVHQNDVAQAKALYESVYERCVFAPARGGALAGLAQIDLAGTSPRLKAALLSSDAQLRHAALSACRVIGQPYIPVLISLLPDLNPEVRAQVIGQLDGSVETALIAVLSDDDETVRRIAAQRLGQVGTSTSVRALLQASAEDTRPVQTEAKTALTRLSGSETTEALRAEADHGPSTTRALAIETLAIRQPPQLGRWLTKWTMDPNPTVVSAALRALGRTGADDEVMSVARLALNTGNDEAFSALEAMAPRVQDGNAISRQLIFVARDNERATVALLDVMGILGGTEALKVLTQQLSGENAETAARALGNWPDFEAAPILLKVASDPQRPAPLRAVAIQSAVQLVSSHDEVAVDERATAAVALLEAAKDAGQKRLALSAAGTVPQEQVATRAVVFLNDEEVKAEAQLACATLAEGLAKSDPRAAAELARTVLATDPPRGVRRRLTRIAEER